MKFILSAILLLLFTLSTTLMAKNNLSNKGERKSKKIRTSSKNKTNKKQKNMKMAIKHLQIAKSSKINKVKIRNILSAKKLLKKATANKGGHRVLAITAINKSLKLLKNKKTAKANKAIQKAINQSRKGIKFKNQ